MATTVALMLAASVLATLAVVAGYVLGWANRAFHVRTDPKEERVLDSLPGVNCGGCGYVGCAEYARAVAEGEAAVNLCAPGGTEVAQALASIMGVEVEESFPYRAVVHCSAYRDQRLQRAPYDGEPTCAAANLVAGVQGCTYGCLGLGDCKRACRYGAIQIVDGLSVIDPMKCVGCKACARACPRNIISIVPFKAAHMLVVACSNQDTAGDVRAVCEVGCLGCRECLRAAPDLISMEGALPAINYDVYQPGDESIRRAVERCPRTRLLFVGRPTEEEAAAVAKEELPDEIRADFRTTVDETEWRG